MSTQDEALKRCHCGGDPCLFPNTTIGIAAMQTEDATGLRVDMLDVDRLREWARLLLVHGADIGHWASVPFVAGRLQTLATDLEKTVRDVGVLRSQRAALLSATTSVVDELNEALQSGALFNPEMFGSMLRPGDNPILRWRDLLESSKPVGAVDPQAGDTPE